MIKAKKSLTGSINGKAQLKGTINVGTKMVYPDLIDLDVTPTKEIQEFNHIGEYGYDNVKVNAIPDEYIIPDGTLDITENGTHDVKLFSRVRSAVYPAPNLQDKSVEIIENKTTNIVADDCFDGLGNVEIVTNIPTGDGTSIKYFTIDDFKQKGASYTYDNHVMIVTNSESNYKAVYLTSVEDGTYYLTTTSTKSSRNSNGFWYVYRYDNSYFYVINFSEMRFYKLTTSNHLSNITAEGTSNGTIGYSTNLKIVVEGTTHKIYVDDVLKLTINNANTIGASHGKTSYDGNIFVVFSGLHKIS